MSMLPPRALVISWLALLALLGATVVFAYQPLGSLNLPLALFIAATKATIVAAVFMELRERDGLTIALAGAGLFWLGILVWLAAVDYATRPQFPPALG
jgi:cytochrome c oxidase subunit 4